VETNQEGYDVGSVVSQQDRSYLRIEVKASVQGQTGRAYITKNEWKVATDDITKHLFYFWKVKDGDQPELAVLDADAVRPHIPTNLGSGQWESTSIPFSSFEECFNKVDIDCSLY